MRHRCPVRAGAVVLALAGVLLAGCAGTVPEPGPPAVGQPVGHRQFALRAEQVLRAWAPSGLATHWRAGLVLMSGPSLTLSEGGLPDDPAHAPYPHWRYRLRAVLPALPPRSGTVTFINGFTTLTVPLISAAAAYQAIRRSPPPPGCADAPCTVFTVTGAALGTVAVYSSRGEAIVPVWRFTVAGLGPILRVAVAPSAVTALPQSLAPERDERYVPIVYGRADQADPRRIVAGLRMRPCQVRPQLHVMETADAVAVAGLATIRLAASCAGLGRPYQAVITLRVPLGRRVLLDAGSGLPVFVAPR
jgi:hypothetical protein